MEVLRSAFGTFWPCLSSCRCLLRADIEVVGVEQEQHLRADQGRFDGQVGERLSRRTVSGSQQDVVVHQDDVGVLVGRRHLVQAAGETARAAEVGLAQVAQLVAEIGAATSVNSA